MRTEFRPRRPHDWPEFEAVGSFNDPLSWASMLLREKARRERER